MLLGQTFCQQDDLDWFESWADVTQHNDKLRVRACRFPFAPFDSCDKTLIREIPYPPAKPGLEKIGQVRDEFAQHLIDRWGTLR